MRRVPEVPARVLSSSRSQPSRMAAIRPDARTPDTPDAAAESAGPGVATRAEAPAYTGVPAHAPPRGAPPAPIPAKLSRTSGECDARPRPPNVPEDHDGRPG